MIMEEIYKDIQGFEGYEVSNKGNVRTKIGKKTIRNDGRVRIWNQRVLKPQINTKGYYVVKLYKNGKQYTKTIHRLLMIAFYPENVKDTVNHIDGNKKNNNIDNLEWCTYSENMLHALDTGLNNCSQGVDLIKDGEIKHFRSLSLASIFLGHNVGYLSGEIKKGKKNVKGYEIICTQRKKKNK